MKLALILFLIFYNYAEDDHFKNTAWINHVASRKDLDLFNFKRNKLLVHYCQKQNHTYYGSYRFAKDTLVICERDNHTPTSKAAYYRLKFLLKNNVLYPLSHEELQNHQWIRSKAQMRKSYVFKKAALS